MIYTNHGLTLIYDTPEVPGPRGALALNDDLSVTVILKPLSPINVVTIPYRVNGGPLQTLRAVAGRTDYEENAQHFHATFPTFSLGQTVDYAVTGSCAGRQVPDLELTSDLPYSFHIAESSVASIPKVSHGIGVTPHVAEPTRFSVVSEFLARFTITIEEPQIVGPTPDGIRVTWNAATGTVVGPRLSARVLQGADWMQIRTDGIGNIDVRAILETGEGARIMSIYSGVMEWGEDGYKNFLARKYPEPLQAWTTQRFLTADSRFMWLNRLQCVSVGEVFMDGLKYVYDVYALQ